MTSRIGLTGNRPGGSKNASFTISSRNIGNPPASSFGINLSGRLGSNNCPKKRMNQQGLTPSPSQKKLVNQTIDFAPSVNTRQVQILLSPVSAQRKTETSFDSRKFGRTSRGNSAEKSNPPFGFVSQVRSKILGRLSVQSFYVACYNETLREMSYKELEQLLSHCEGELTQVKSLLKSKKNWSETYVTRMTKFRERLIYTRRFFQSSLAPLLSSQNL